MKPGRPFTPQPDRFCARCGRSTGIHVPEGYDLCLEHYRAYKRERGL